MLPDALPREPLRRQLAALGIARERHAMASLVEMLPVRVEGYPGFDADSVAQVLVHLVGRGLIALPEPEAKELAFRWGERIGYRYREEAELLALLLPYFRQGLAGGERCLWLMGDEPSAKARRMVAALADTPYSPDQLELLRAGEWENDLGAWTREEQRALSQGYAGLRICGEALELPEGTAALRIKALSTYGGDALPPARVVLVNDRGRWTRR